jgi:hypothetical protein
MPYTHFRYIAYEVPTIAKTTGGIVYGLEHGAIEAPPELKGGMHPFLVGDDARTRIERLVGLMIEAHTYLTRTGDDENTLKIFMAPEFYFRPKNDKLAYTYEQYQSIKKILRETILGDARFNNWLVIPGTVIWIWNDKHRKPDKRPEVPTDMDVYMNTTIPIKKDFAKTVIEKAEASGRDGIPPGSEKRYSNQVWSTYYKSGAKLRKHFFTAGGISFGLEICKEHDLQILKKTLSLTDYAAAGVAIQLLTAGGMEMDRGSVVAKPGGFVLRNDGFNSEGMNALPWPDQFTDYKPGLEDKDRNENDGTPGYTPPTSVKDHTNMRKVIKYREPVEEPKKESAEEGKKEEREIVKSLKDSTPAAVKSRPYLMRMITKHDIEIASGSKYHLPVSGDLFSTNATQRLRIFEKQPIPA